MKLLSSNLVIIFFLLLTFLSCYYDSEEALYPVIGTSCDTTDVTFTGTVSPMLANNCYSCHSNASSASFGNGIAIENYADVKARAISIQGSVKHSASYSPMPKNGGKLNPCLIDQFDIWIKNGMPNN